MLNYLLSQVCKTLVTAAKVFQTDIAHPKSCPWSRWRREWWWSWWGERWGRRWAVQVEAAKR